MARRINIAIDGYAGVGKSTTARRLADALGYVYIDTGAMYRAVTLHLLDNNIPITDPEAVAAALPGMQVEFRREGHPPQQVLYLNNHPQSLSLRSPQVNAAVSPVAAISAVRRFLVAQQQEMARRKGVVMDGRDIGTVVLPDAELKVFITADLPTRVERRQQELAAQGVALSPTEIQQNLVERDRIDSTRADSPLRQAPDARVLDTTTLSIDEQVDHVLQWARECCLQPQASPTPAP